MKIRMALSWWISTDSVGINAERHRKRYSGGSGIIFYCVYSYLKFWEFWIFWKNQHFSKNLENFRKIVILGHFWSFCIRSEILDSCPYQKPWNFYEKFRNFWFFSKIMPDTPRIPNSIPNNPTDAPDRPKTSRFIFGIFRIFAPRPRISLKMDTLPRMLNFLIWDRLYARVVWSSPCVFQKTFPAVEQRSRWVNPSRPAFR